jgi:hypothetical protein
MNIFELRKQVVGDCGTSVRSVIKIHDLRIGDEVDRQLVDGLVWAEPLIPLNPAFEPGEPLRDLVDRGVFHSECPRLFSAKDTSRNLNG